MQRLWVLVLTTAWIMLLKASQETHKTFISLLVGESLAVVSTHSLRGTVYLLSSLLGPEVV